jgi:hypothetical protein
MHMATPNRRGHKETLNRQGQNTTMILVWSMIVMVVNALMRKDYCIVFVRKKLLENKKEA